MQVFAIAWVCLGRLLAWLRAMVASSAVDSLKNSRFLP